MIGRYAYALLIACASSSALAQQTPAPDTSALYREVEQLNRGMEAAFNRGDLRGAAAFYADDAIVRTARSIVAQGRAALDQYFLDIADPKSWKLDVIQVGGTRDMAFQVGRSTLVHGNPEPHLGGPVPRHLEAADQWTAPDHARLLPQRRIDAAPGQLS